MYSILDSAGVHDGYSFLQLTAENPTIKAKYLKDYCASAHIIMTLLLKGYKFNTIWDQISFQKRVRTSFIIVKSDVILQILINIAN